MASQRRRHTTTDREASRLRPFHCIGGRRCPLEASRDYESHGQAGQETVVRGCEVDPAVASVTVEAPQRIEVEDGARMTITWEDDRVDRFSAAVLRAACPCAGCREVASAAPDTRIDAVRMVGNYAIGMTFGPDGHATGIYPFNLLRSLGAERA